MMIVILFHMEIIPEGMRILYSFFHKSGLFFVSLHLFTFDLNLSPHEPTPHPHCPRRRRL